MAKKVSKKAKDIVSGLDSKLDKLLDAKLDEKFDASMDKIGTKLENEQGKKLYTGFTKADVKKMTWQEKGFQFINALAHNDKEKLDGLTEGTPADGGYLVPDEFRAEIIKKLHDTAVIRPRARVIPMSSDTLKIPTTDSSVKTYWTAEAASKTTTSAQFDEFELSILKLAAVMVASDELLEDSSVGVIEYLTEEFANAIAIEEDRVFTSGNGTTEPAGLDSYTLTTVDAGGALAYGHFVDAWTTLKQGYRANSVWIAHSQVIAEIFKLQDGNARPLILDIPSKPNPVLMGRPILECNSMDTTKIFFGDLGKYIIGDKGEMRMATSNEAYVASTSMFQTDQTAIRVVKRMDAGLPQTEAFVEMQNVQA